MGRPLGARALSAQPEGGSENRCGEAWREPTAQSGPSEMAPEPPFLPSSEGRDSGAERGHPGLMRGLPELKRDGAQAWAGRDRDSAGPGEACTAGEDSNQFRRHEDQRQPAQHAPHQALQSEHPRSHSSRQPPPGAPAGGTAPAAAPDASAALLRLRAPPKGGALLSPPAPGSGCRSTPHPTPTPASLAGQIQGSRPPSLSAAPVLSGLARHLRPGPLIVCFLIGLVAGLVSLEEPIQLPSLHSPGHQHEHEHPHRAAEVSGAVASLGASSGTQASAAVGRDAPVGKEATGPEQHSWRVTAELRVHEHGPLGEAGPSAPHVDRPLEVSPEEAALAALGMPAPEHCNGNGDGPRGIYAREPQPVLPGPPPVLLLVVTPTYVRPFQAMFLQRLANTLRLVPPPLLWIVVESGAQSEETSLLLRRTGLPTRHLGSTRPMRSIKDRGVQQRNAGLEYIEEHRLEGVVYFADDDNVYSPALFSELRKIRRFGTWPVAMLQEGKSKATIEGPVCEGQRVTGWHTNEKSKRLRRFHVDMSGFAFNSSILWNPALFGRPTNASIRQLDTVKEGFQETTFIEQLVPDESAMEGMADGCRDVLVWHLHSEAPKGSPFPRFSAPTKYHAVIPARKWDGLKKDG